MPTKSELKIPYVWQSKNYRRKVLTEEIQIFLKKALLEKGTENNYFIEAMEVMEDHIHIFKSFC